MEASITSTQFPKTVRTAKAVSTDKKALAEAIWTEIPPRANGRPAKSDTPVPTVDELLASMSADLTAEGYDYPVSTLEYYRKVATWVAGKGSEVRPLSWQSVSWSTHVEAWQGGMTWAAFVKNVESGKVANVDDVRRLLGKAAARKNRPTEKVQEVKDLIDSGTVSAKDVIDTLTEGMSEDELADAIDEDKTTDSFMGHRRRRAAKSRAEGAEGMSDEEVAATDQALAGMGEAADRIDQMADKMAEDVLGGKVVPYSAKADHFACTALLFANKFGFRDKAEQDKIRYHNDRCRQAFDLIEMLMDGNTLSDEDIEFLASIGVLGGE